MFSPAGEGQDSQITGTGWAPVRYPTTGQSVNCEAATYVDVRVRRGIVQVQIEQTGVRPVIPVATVIKSCPEVLLYRLNPSANNLTDFIDMQAPNFISMNIDIAQGVAFADQAAQIFHFDIHVLQASLFMKAFCASNGLVNEFGQCLADLHGQYILFVFGKLL